MKRLAGVLAAFWLFVGMFMITTIWEFWAVKARIFAGVAFVLSVFFMWYGSRRKDPAHK